MRQREIGFVIAAVLGVVSLAIGAPRASVGSAGPGVRGHAAGQDTAAEYRGAKDGCRKCHLKQYRSWQKTPHAKSLEALSGDERTDPQCLRCHTTGYGEPTGYSSEKSTPGLASVACEACHGTGSGYRDKSTMKDLDAAIAKGLHVPDEQTCIGCHNAESPHFPGSFDFQQMKAKGVHEIKTKS